MQSNTAVPAVNSPRIKTGTASKYLVLLLVLSSLGAIVFFNLRERKTTETFASIPAQRGDVVEKLAERGTIELLRTIEVKSTVSGEILKLPVQTGDWVVKDQLVAVIERDQSQAPQLYQKRPPLARNDRSLAEPGRYFPRKRVSVERQVLTSATYGSAETKIARARDGLSLAEPELQVREARADTKQSVQEEASLSVDEVRLLSPIDGIVIRREVEVGELVVSGLASSSGGAVLFEIGDPSQMIARANIAEIDIARVHIDQKVDIVVEAYPDTTYDGRVRWIAPVGRKMPGSPLVTFEVEVDIVSSAPQLRQGMSCNLDVILSRRDNTLFLPVEAVFEITDDELAKNQAGKISRVVAYVVNRAHSSDEGASIHVAGTRRETEPAVFAHPLDEFVEIELLVGLETSTGIEILQGLDESDRVAEDPARIRQSLVSNRNSAEMAKP